MYFESWMKINRIVTNKSKSESKNKNSKQMEIEWTFMDTWDQF